MGKPIDKLCGRLISVQSAFFFMSLNDSELQAQVRRILEAIAFIPFEQCQPLSRDFANIPVRPKI